MRAIFAIVLLAGLGLAGFAVMQAQGRFEQYRTALDQTASQVIETKPVFVVQRRLRYGDVLTKNDVAAIRWPAESLPPGAFETMEQIFPPGEDGNRTVLRVMERGEPLLLVKVTEPGADAGVAASLTPGMRAFALQVDLTSGVAGLLRPGDRVDVYWTGSGITRLIHASLQIIAIDQDTDNQRTSAAVARTVTVEAPAGVVAKLAQAQATGRLTLALVGVHDDTESEMVEATLDAVLGPQEVAERTAVCTIRNRRGSEVKEIPVPCPAGTPGSVPAEQDQDAFGLAPPMPPG